MNSKIGFIVFMAVLVMTSPLNAMEYTTRKLALWKKGESISGDDFIAANEQVVDYLATLERPTGSFKAIVYQCQIKSRLISPYIQQQNVGGNANTSYVYLLSVYDIKDCVKAN